ncbi:hypothetical protein SDC9_148429 [bioreactor metagenome]|uniref:Uncharacterized protein n=1 Tax=bioreactor metagenome TaxID=1076179 RepID=A0A645EKZ5_9ZZZZ
MLARQQRQARNQPARGKRGHRRQRQRATVPLMRHHVQRIALQPLQPASDLLAVVAPRLGQRHSMSRASK